MASGNGKLLSDIKTGAGYAIGFSLALGAIKIVNDMIGGIIPRPFVLANAGTFNTLSPDSTFTEYTLH